MKKLTIGLMVLSLLATFSIVGLADSTANHGVDVKISDLHLLALNDTSSITLEVTSGTAGQLPGVVTNTTKALEYLVISGSDYKITEAVGKSTTDNYDLQVEATSVNAQYTGINNSGSPGSSAGTVTLGTSSGDLITGVTSPVITGNKDAELKYTLIFNDVPKPDTGGTTYNVTYTLTSTN